MNIEEILNELRKGAYIRNSRNAVELIDKDHNAIANIGQFTLGRMVDDDLIVSVSIYPGAENIYYKLKLKYETP